MNETGNDLHFMVIDCCEHTLAALRKIPFGRSTVIKSRGGELSGLDEASDNVDLMVIGVAHYPVRRLFISQLRRIYPTIPVLILRREESSISGGAENVRGEFVLSDQQDENDCRVVNAVRKVLPLKPCEHARKRKNYDTVREVTQLIVQNYRDPDLNLERIARFLTVSPARLSRILNQQVGVSFRQMLRHTRIEEAKRMLASRRYSVKEVAAQVGFTDSHYFSRSFKQLTGLSASDYRAQGVMLN